MERYAHPLHRLNASALAVALLLAGAAGAAPVGNVARAAPPSGTPVRTPAATPAATPDDDQPEVPVPTTRSRNTPVTLNFVNADIEAVSRAIGAMLDRQVLVDPRVKGTITVYNDKPQPLSEAYRNYLSALRGLGFTVVESGGFLKVVPEADAKLQTGVVSVGTPSVRGDQVLTQIFHLTHENPNNLVAVLRPLITANNTINASPANNSLVITDYADNLQRLGKIIAALDQPAGAEVDVVTLKNAVASDIVQTVQKLVDGGGGPTTGPGVASQATAATQVIVEPRSNSLIVRASNASRMANARMIIDKLDQPVQGAGPAGNIWVVYLKNADATKLAEVLRAAVANGSIGGGGGSSGGGGTSSPAYAPGGGGTTPTAPASPGGTSTGSTSAASAQTTTPVSASARPSTGGQIQADPATNSLIITAPEPQYRQMRQVIDQLDVRRAQVYVEALMISVDATKAAEFGFQWQGLLAAGQSYIGAGTNFTPGSGNSGDNILNLSLGAAALGGNTGGTTPGGVAVASQLSLPSNGLNIGFVPKINGIYTLAALAHFLETNAGANVLATPNIVALDNEEAKIVVGQNIPLITGSYTNTGVSNAAGNVNPFQTVERQDVGITLRIRSQIGENGTVRMTIYEENSSVQPGNSQVTNKTSVETFVTVNDGGMIALGGLIKDEYGDNESGIPVLSSIPILGNLFKSTGRSRHKSNLMLFLRPLVMRTQNDSDRITVNRYDAIREQQQSLQPPSSIVTPVNDAPLVPPLRPDTKPDPNAPHDPATQTLPLVSPPPTPADLNQPPAAVPAPLPPTSAAPGTTTTTTTTTTTVKPVPAPGQ